MSIAVIIVALIQIVYIIYSYIQLRKERKELNEFKKFIEPKIKEAKGFMNHIDNEIARLKKQQT